MADAAVKATNQTAGPPWLIKDVSTWPGGFGAYKYSQSAVMLNISTIIVLIALGFVLSLFQNVLPGAVYAVVYTVGTALLYVVQYLVYLRSAQGEKIEVADAFKEGLDVMLVLNMIALAIMVGVTIVVGFILFIIPGIIVLPRLVLSPYYLIDKKLNCVEAFQASWNGTKGHSGKVWGVIGVSFLMLLPILTIIGILVSIFLLFMYAAVSAVLYEYVKKVGPVAK